MWQVFEVKRDAWAQAFLRLWYLSAAIRACGNLIAVQLRHMPRDGLMALARRIQEETSGAIVLRVATINVHDWKGE